MFCWISQFSGVRHLWSAFQILAGCKLTGVLMSASRDVSRLDGPLPSFKSPHLSLPPSHPLFEHLNTVQTHASFRMPHKSRWTVAVPEESLPTYMFRSPDGALPDGLAYADADEPASLFLTWGDFRLWSQRFAAGLVVAGLQPGDRVVVSVSNDVLFPVLMTGVIMVGGIFSPANPRFVTRELVHQLRVAEPIFLFVTDGTLTTGIEAAEAVGMGRDRVFLFDNAPLRRTGAGDDPEALGVRHWKHLLVSEEEGRKYHWEELSPEASKARGGVIAFSSG